MEKRVRKNVHVSSYYSSQIRVSNEILSFKVNFRMDKPKTFIAKNIVFISIVDLLKSTHILICAHRYVCKGVLFICRKFKKLKSRPL